MYFVSTKPVSQIAHNALIDAKNTTLFYYCKIIQIYIIQKIKNNIEWRIFHCHYGVNEF